MDAELLSELVRLLDHFGSFGAVSDTIVRYMQSSPLYDAKKWTAAQVRATLTSQSNKRPIKPIVRLSRAADVQTHRRVSSVTASAIAIDPSEPIAADSTNIVPQALFYVTRVNYQRAQEARIRAASRIEVEILPARLAEPNERNSQTGLLSNLIPYHVFPLVLCQNDTPCGGVVFKRYSDFAQLRQRLEPQFPHLPMPNISEKRIFGNSKPSFLDKRRVGLEAFLNHILEHDELCRHPAVMQFLFEDPATAPCDISSAPYFLGETQHGIERLCRAFSGPSHRISITRSDLKKRIRRLSDVSADAIASAQRLGLHTKEFGRIQSDWFRSFSELCEVHGIFAPLAAVARLGQKQFDLGRWIDLIFSEHFAYHSRHAAILTDWLNDAHSSSTSPASHYFRPISSPAGSAEAPSASPIEFTLSVERADSALHEPFDGVSVTHAIPDQRAPSPAPSPLADEAASARQRVVTPTNECSTSVTEVGDQGLALPVDQSLVCAEAEVVQFQRFRDRDSRAVLARFARRQAALAEEQANMFQQLYTSILRDWPDELALFPGVNVEARPLSTPTSNESAPAQVPSIPAVSAVPDQVSGGTFSSDMPTNVVPTMVHAMQIERAEKQQQQQQHAHAHHQSRLDDEWRIRFAELKLGRVIGAGSFGIVHAGVWRGSEVAIKRFTLTELLPDAVREFHAETMLMSQLHHRNIVLFLGACLEPPHLCLITERLDMSVQDLLSSSAPLRISQMLLMAIDACRGVHALHSRQPPTLHRDIKSSNLLVDTSGELRVCVCDFGLARIRRRNQARLTLCGTTAWLAPEIVTSDGWTEKSDVYALAIVLYELFSRRLPYEHIQSPQTVMFQVVNDSLRPVIPATCPESVAALMQSAWAADPTVRPTVQCMIDELTRLLAYYRRHPTQDSFVVRATD